MTEWLGPLMFLVCFGLIFSGYPVAFALGGSALLFFLGGLVLSGAGVEGVFILESDLLMFPSRIFGVMSNQVLLAVPFFIFMGVMLEKSGLAEDLLTTIGQLFGRVRGGLARSFLQKGPFCKIPVWGRWVQARAGGRWAAWVAGAWARTFFLHEIPDSV